jgi:hypothetical protein
MDFFGLVCIVIVYLDTYGCRPAHVRINNANYLNICVFA